MRLVNFREKQHIVGLHLHCIEEKTTYPIVLYRIILYCLASYVYLNLLASRFRCRPGLYKTNAGLHIAVDVVLWILGKKKWVLYSVKIENYRLSCSCDSGFAAPASLPSAASVLKTFTWPWFSLDLAAFYTNGPTHASSTLNDARGDGKWGIKSLP